MFCEIPKCVTNSKLDNTSNISDFFENEIVSRLSSSISNNECSAVCYEESGENTNTSDFS